MCFLRYLSYKILSFIPLFFIFNSNGMSHDCITMDDAKSIYKGFPNKLITVIKKDITFEEAYCGQEKLNFLIKRNNNDQIGYKVGFTSKESQKMFNINQPATGVIYKHMFLKNEGTLDYNFGYQNLIEPDILVIIKSKDIMQAKSNVDILKNIHSLHPFLEIISYRFDPKTRVNGNMVIATNMLATKMVMGKGIKVKATEDFILKLENINTVFIKDENNILQEAKTTNLMGSPLNVIKWLINDFNKRGITLKKNDHISLGSIGKIFNLEKNSKYEYFFEGFENKLAVNININ